MAIELTADEQRKWRAEDDGRPFVLVQLLKFRPGGRDKYLAYSVHAQPILNVIGATILYAGETAGAHPWDAAIVVRYPSRGSYLDMHELPEFKAHAGLRADALEDALFLPMNDWAGR